MTTMTMRIPLAQVAAVQRVARLRQSVGGPLPPPAQLLLARVVAAALFDCAPREAMGYCLLGCGRAGGALRAPCSDTWRRRRRQVATVDFGRRPTVASERRPASGGARHAAFKHVRQCDDRDGDCSADSGVDSGGRSNSGLLRADGLPPPPAAAYLVEGVLSGYCWILPTARKQRNTRQVVTLPAASIR